MVDVSDSKLKQLVGKPWSTWNLPGCSTEFDSVKLREVYKPRQPDKPADCNLLPASLMQLYGTQPDIEFFSVSKCPACRNVMKTQWICRHYKRDSFDNFVCRRTEMIVFGGKCLGKATTPLYEIKESTRTAVLEFTSSFPSPVKVVKATSHTIVDVETVPTPAYSPTRSKHSSLHKTETSSSSSNKSKFSSQNKSKSTSNSSSSQSHSSSSKHKSSSKSHSSSSSSWTHSKKESKSHKSSSSTGSYVLSIPSDDSGHDSVESILLSNASNQPPKHHMHIITMPSAKSKSSEPEYEQLKFYADSSDKRSKAHSLLSESESTKLTPKLQFSPHLETSTFKIPLKSKSLLSTSSTGSLHSDGGKKSKSSHSHSHQSKSSFESSKITFRSPSASSTSTSTSNSHSKLPQTALLSSYSEAKAKSIATLHQPISNSDIKEKEKSSSGHSKKKKKKKDKDEPRKVIPLKERAFHPDQHCGVVPTDASLPCTRSLTCKTHSIALRRAVPGRSHPFDSLLAAHKKARDEEKSAKVKDHAEESKSKHRKSSQPAISPSGHTTSISISQTGAINSTKTSVGVTSKATVGISGKGASGLAAKGTSAITKGSSGTTGSKVHSTAVTSVLASVVSAPSSNGKKASVSNAGPKPGGSQAPSHRHLAKTSSTTKITNRPVIVVEERKEVQGLSLFDIVKEPENNFVYISSIAAPKIVTDLKGIAGKGPFSKALSEWNPLDGLHKRGNFRKGMKDPFIMILPKKIQQNAICDSNAATVPVIGNDTTSNPISSGLEGDKSGSDSRTSENSVRLNIHAKTVLKRNATQLIEVDSVVPAKKARLLTQPRHFYESLLFKQASQQGLLNHKISNVDACRIDGTSLAADGREAVATVINKLHSQMNEPQSPLGSRTNTDDISPEGREFLKNLLKSKSSSKEGTSDTKESSDDESTHLTKEELYARALEEIARLI